MKKHQKITINPFGIYCLTVFVLDFLSVNGYVAYETAQKIKDENTLEEKIYEAKRLKRDVTEDWIFTPFLIGEYIVACHYLDELEKQQKENNIHQNKSYEKEHK